jgi:outer membrane protein
LIVKRSVTVLLSAVMALGIAPTVSAQIKIGVVEVQRLLTESPQGKAAKEKLNAEFGPKFKEIETKAAALQARQDKFKKDEATMTELQKTQLDKELQSGYRDLQLRKSAFDDEAETAHQDAQGKVLRELDEEVKAFAKAQGYDLILQSETAVAYVTAAFDVTGAILQVLNTRKPAAAAPASAAPPANKPPAALAK